VRRSKIKYQISKINLVCAVIALGVFVCAAECFAQASASSELIGWAKHYDGKKIVFEGEIIGDIMVRGSKAWINIHDGANGIGVWMDAGLLSNRLRAGSYTAKGSWVSVAGVFSRSCPEHGGDLDIHADSLNILHDGSSIPERVNLQKSGRALAAMMGAGSLWLALFLWDARKEPGR
jgi:hypothetical protein